MIEIINRELIIPREEFNIGTNYDTNSEVRLFHMHRVIPSGVDIANLTFVLDIKYANDKTDAVGLDKSIDDKDITLTLKISSTMLQVPGTVLIQLRALDADGKCRWTSYNGALFVEDAINTPAQYEGKLTELERLETEQIAFKKAEDARAAAETVRQNAESERNQAEAKRSETFTNNEKNRQNTFDNAISDFNNDRQELKDYRNLAESYAHGGTGTRSGEDNDNAEYYASLALQDYNQTNAKVEELEKYVSEIATWTDPDLVDYLHTSVDGFREMLYTNRFTSLIQVNDTDDGKYLTNDDGTPILADWSYHKI